MGNDAHLVIALIVIIIINSGLIVPSAAADGLTLINNVSSFESPYGTIFVNATSLENVVTLPLYYGSLGENGSINTQLQQIGKERQNVTTESEAPAVAQRLLKHYGGLPPDAVLNGASTTYLETYDHALQTVTNREPMFTTISYSRDIDGFWVFGDGNTIILTLGENGELLRIFKIWRDYTYTGDVNLIPVYSAFGKLRQGELLNNPIVTGEKITIDIATPDYYAKTIENGDTVLEPIWLLVGTTESGSRLGFYVYARQFANFTASPASASTGDTISFTDTSEASPVKWSWDFGDGTNSTLKNPTHAYQTGGNYTVNLTAWNDLGSDSLSRQEYITIYPDPKPDANFTSNYSWNNRVPPLVVSYNDTSVGYITNWSWDFGDGTNSSEQSPTHVFDLIPGDVEDYYSINLTITDRYGRTSTTYDTVYVQMDYYPDFIAEPIRGPAPLNVTFTDTSPPLTHIDGLWWDFGDGTSFNWYNDGTGVAPPHSVYHDYTSNGNYSVTLSIMPSFHSERSYKSIKEDLIFVGSIHPPDADFTANITSGKVPLTISFTDSSTESPTNWNWSFGDGVVSDEQNPAHTYLVPGSYSVVLTVKNPDGNDTEPRPDYISVQSLTPPIAVFTANTTSGKVPLAVKFNDLSSGSPTRWSWTFGDGEVSAEQNPVHTYSGSGQFTVTLLVANEDGINTTVKEQFIAVSNPVLPVAEFVANRTTGKAPLTVGFTDQSTGSPLRWYWTFGDGETSDDQTPSHIYLGTGTYTVSLEVTNPDGSNTTTKINYITMTSGVLSPVASFTGKPTCGKAPLTVRFNDASTGSPTAWYWDFGDGTNATEQNPVHVYTMGGKYTVSLTATNAGDSNISVRKEYITVSGTGVKPPVANFYAKPTSGKAPLSVKFTDASTGFPTSWFWFFGDGTNSTDQNPVHVYKTPGKYSVSLTATNAGGGNTKTRTQYISVSGPAPTPTPTYTCTPSQCEPHEVPHVTGTTENGKIRLDWDVIINPCLQGYKVVISKNNPNPKYPDDGYMFWITDRNRNYSLISSSDHYNSGDFGGYLQPGQRYYFSITAVYSDTKVAGNAVELVYPGTGTPTTTKTTMVTSKPTTTCTTRPTTTSTQNTCEPYTVPLLNGSINQDKRSGWTGM